VNAAFVWRTALKDLARRMHDPWAFVFWVGMPLLVAGLILLAFGGRDAGPPVAQVLLVDRDDSLASGLLASALGRAPTIQVERLSDSVEARARIDDGAATALVVIPRGFQDAVLNDMPVRVEVLTNPGQRILPGMVTETLALVAEAGFYLQRTFGEELRAFAAGPPQGGFAFPQGEFNTLGGGINAKVGRLGPILSPPLIGVETAVDSTGAPGQPGMGALFFPGILFMALLFMSSGLAHDVWIEKGAGTLRRAVAAPQRMRDFLAGKLLAGAMLMAVVSTAALSVGSMAFDVPWTALPLGVAWATFAGTAFLTLVTLLHLYASSARTAGVFSTMIIFPLLMAGGSFFPFEAMPAWLARIGRLTPNGWALEQLKAILWGGVEPGALGIAFLALAAVAGAAFLAGAAHMRRSFVRR